MAQKNINITDPGSDRIADAFGKVNDNDTELYDHVGDATNPHGVTAVQAGALTQAEADDIYKAIGYVPAWLEITSKPKEFPPSAHKTSHATGGEDALAASDINAAPRLSPALNLMPDSGRYGGKQNPMYMLTPGAYSNLGWLAGFNGTTDAEIGKFIHNNTTNGGTLGALAQPVIDLLAAMGRTGTAARYGAEFRVPAYTMGTGTAAPYVSGGVTRYFAVGNNARAMFGPGALNTFATWIRCTAASVVFQRRSLAGLGGVVRSKLDGVEQTGDIILTPQNGWKHVLILAKTFAGYDSNHPYIYAETGATFEVACPYFAAGEVNLDWRNDHAAPLPTINELLA